MAFFLVLLTPKTLFFENQPQDFLLPHRHVKPRNAPNFVKKSESPLLLEGYIAECDNWNNSMKYSG